MQSGELVELAALLATHSDSIVGCEARLNERSLQQYWTTSRCRMDRWSRSLNRFTTFTEKERKPLEASDTIWCRLRGELEEIFTAEVITRVWTAIAVAYDARHQSSELESTARSILIGHIEVRHRALRLLVDPVSMQPAEAEWLNLLRRRCDRWTDLLIGRLLARQLGNVSDISCDRRRAAEFADDLKNNEKMETECVAWPMITTSLRAAFQKTKETPSPNADLNAAVVTSLLACFPADLFDSIGLVGSLWIARLENLADDVELLIAEIVQPDPG